MANRYYVGPAAGAWNLNANWSAASGGAGGASFPVAGDNAFLDAGSAGNGPTLVAAAACDQLDCAGFAGTLNLGGFALTIGGTLFTLVAGMTFTEGGATPAVDFTAAAGTVLITSAGKDLGSVRFGNVAVGGTYQLQDPLTVTRDLDCVRGTFVSNNQNILVKRDVWTRLTMVADGFRLGSSTLEIQRTWDNARAGVMNTATGYGTSTVRCTGTGSIGAVGFAAINFWNLHIAEAGKTTTIRHTGSGSTQVFNVLTTGTGTVTTTNSNRVVFLGALNQPFQPNLAVTWGITVAFSPPVGQALYELPGLNYGVGLVTVENFSAATAWELRLTGNVVCSGFPMYLAGTSTAKLINLNGFNLTVNGTIAGSLSPVCTFIIGAATLTATTINYNQAQNLPRTGESRYFSLTTGKLIVTGNLTMTAGTVNSRIQLGAGAEVRVGGSWNTTGNGPCFNAADQAGIVNFTAAGPFSIACLATELWPIVQITGGGSTTLPNGFNCYDLLISAGLITAGNPLTVRNNFVNGGTFTAAGSMSVGSSFVNTGTLILAGSNIRCTGAVCSVSGVNPNSLTMTATCLRLQLLTGMNITTFIFENRLTPGIVQFVAGGTYNIGTTNSQIASTDGTAELVSSVAGLRYNFNVTVATSIKNLWPRDSNAVTPLTGDLTNKDLGNNLGWTLNAPGYISVSTDDPGTDLLVMGGVSKMQFCWFVATSLVTLTAQVAAFATGSNNWHRKTNIPFAMLDNLQLYTNYFLAVGMIDDRGNRLVPNVGAGDYTSAPATHREDALATQRHHLHVDVSVPYGA